MTDTQALIERLTHCSHNTKDEYLHELTGRAAIALTEAEAKLKTVLDREAKTIRRYDAKLDDAEAKLAKAREAMRKIEPYLVWAVSAESPGWHPTMPSAVAEFSACLAELENG